LTSEDLIPTLGDEGVPTVIVAGGGIH
jgi:hypothetical protein